MQPAKNTQLFKYYRFDKYGLYAIYNNILWLSNPKYFTDPYDSNLNFLIDNETQNGREFRIKAIKETRDNLGVCCFTNTWSDVRMWTEYAANHTGFCIEYDLSLYEEVLNNIGLPMILETVHYTDYPYQNTDSNLPKHLEDLLDRRDVFNLTPKELDILTQGLILTKDRKLYEHEKEVRLITSSVIADKAGASNLLHKTEKGYSAKLPKGCIKAIYFGAKSDAIDESRVLDFLGTIHQGYIKTRWVRLGPMRGELVADSKPDAEVSDILSGCRIYSNR